MSSDIIPAKAEVVTTIGVCPQAQQFAFDARTSKTSLRLLIVTVCEVLQNAVATVINEIRHRIVKKPLIENPFPRANIVGGF